MATQNRWEIGTMYRGGLSSSGLPLFTQPLGPGTAVQPREIQGANWPEFPVTGMQFSYGPWFSPGCLHVIKFWSLVREWDYDTNMSCCLITCSQCSFVQRVVEPYEEILNPIENAIIV